MKTDQTSGRSSHSRLAAEAAIVAAELYSAGELAQNLSLVAKNTRTLVVRAGNTALGLKVITEYFSELADQIIGLTKTINSLAVNISKASVLGWQIDNLCSSIDKAQETAVDAKYVASLADVAANGALQRDKLGADFTELLRSLEQDLENISTLMRSTDVVSVSFKLEATQTGDQEKILTEMASEIIRLSEAIKHKVHKSKELVLGRRIAT